MCLGFNVTHYLSIKSEFTYFSNICSQPSDNDDGGRNTNAIPKEVGPSDLCLLKKSINKDT